MRRMLWIAVLPSCASTPVGDWSGFRECPGAEPQAIQVQLEPMANGWRGLGQVEWDDTNLGERFLLFDLEMLREGGEWVSQLRDCGLEWGGVVEDTGCPQITLAYEDEDEPTLSGELVGCPVTMGLET